MLLGTAAVVGGAVGGEEDGIAAAAVGDWLIVMFDVDVGSVSHCLDDTRAN